MIVVTMSRLIHPAIFFTFGFLSCGIFPGKSSDGDSETETTKVATAGSDSSDQTPAKTMASSSVDSVTPLPFPGYQYSNTRTTFRLKDASFSDKIVMLKDGSLFIGVSNGTGTDWRIKRISGVETLQSDLVIGGDAGQIAAATSTLLVRGRTASKTLAPTIGIYSATFEKSADIDAAAYPAGELYAFDGYAIILSASADEKKSSLSAKIYDLTTKTWSTVDPPSGALSSEDNIEPLGANSKYIAALVKGKSPSVRMAVLSIEKKAWTLIPLPVEEYSYLSGVASTFSGNELAVFGGQAGTQLPTRNRMLAMWFDLEKLQIIRRDSIMLPSSPNALPERAISCGGAVYLSGAAFSDQYTLLRRNSDQKYYWFRDGNESFTKQLGCDKGTLLYTNRFNIIYLRKLDGL